MRIKKFKQFFINEKLRIPKYKCPVCGGELYRTDAGGETVTLQCASDAARFWDFGRGTEENRTAHKHFMDSRTIISNDEWNKFKIEVN